MAGRLTVAACAMISALLAATAGGAPAEAQSSLPVREAPPKRKYEPRPPLPGFDRVWIQGHWRRLAGRWIWTSGRYVRQPDPTLKWVDGDWEERRIGYVWRPGVWVPKEELLLEREAEEAAPGALSGVPPPG